MNRDMEIFFPLARTKEGGERNVISGSGWKWARLRGGGNSLGYRRGRGQSK